jgi:phosphatidylglycerol:prolipoprotein diacylglycerol transferase
MAEMTIGPIILHLYGIIFTIAVIAGFLVARKRAEIYEISKDQVENIFLLALFLGILGARLYHVLDYFSYYRTHLWEILAVWQGGLGIFGGIFGGILGIYFYAKSKSLPFLKICDLLAPSLALGQAIGRWGNFVNQEAFGPPTSLPWKIYIDFQNRPEFWVSYSFFHPVFVYESIWNFLSFLALIYLEKQSLQKRKVGSLTFSYFTLYGLGRFFIEFLRFDTAQILGVKLAHILSLGFIFGGFFFLKQSGIIKKKGKS